MKNKEWLVRVAVKEVHGEDFYYVTAPTAEKAIDKARQGDFDDHIQELEVTQSDWDEAEAKEQ